MWRAYDALGFLEYSFAETVAAMHPFYVIRGLGGVLYLAGAAVMVFNLWQTVARCIEEARMTAPHAARSRVLRGDWNHEIQPRHN